MVFWTPQLSLWEGIVTTALLLPLSAIVALFTGKR